MGLGGGVRAWGDMSPKKTTYIFTPSLTNAYNILQIKRVKVVDFSGLTVDLTQLHSGIKHGQNLIVFYSFTINF